MAKQCGCIPGSFLCPEAERLWHQYLYIDGGEEAFQRYERHMGYRKPCGCVVAGSRDIRHCPEAERLYREMEQAAQHLDNLQRSGPASRIRKAWQRWVDKNNAYIMHMHYNPDTDTDL